MSDIINLRLARKAKKRTVKGQTADENRVRYGRTKAEKKLDKFNAEQEQREHTGRRLTDVKDGAKTQED